MLAPRYAHEINPVFPERHVGYMCSLELVAVSCEAHHWIRQFDWEDFAECFAHYLHITDTIDTVREAGLVLHADRVRISAPRDIV
jgi:hypothetical protein